MHAAFLKGFIHVGSGSNEGRNKPKNQQCDGGDYGGESEDALVQMHVSRKACRNEFLQNFCGPETGYRPEKRPNHDQQQTLRKQLPDKPQAPRTEGYADRNLPAASNAAREQQIGYISASD